MMISPREQEVLALIAQGASDREIAAQLGMAFSTARKHRENLKIKLNVRKSAQLAMLFFAAASPLPKKVA